MRPWLGVNFDGVLDEIPEQPAGRRVASPLTPVAAWRRDRRTAQYSFSAMSLRQISAASRSRIVGVDHFKLQFDLALADAGEVEQIINEAGFEFDIAADDFQIFLDVFGEAFVGLQTGERWRGPA